MAKAYCVMIKADGKFYTRWRKKKDDLGEQGWRSPPTNVAHVRFPVPVSYVG